MTKPPNPPAKAPTARGSAASSRDARRAAALKANIARRKAGAADAKPSEDDPD